MIRLILNGGLGNQMFQYAAGRALSLRLQAELKIDLSFFVIHRNKPWCRNYELDVFNLQNPVLAKSLQGVVFCRLKEIFERSGYGREKALSFGLFSDKYSSRYDSHFENLKNGIALYGYFQNEKYFKNYSEKIRRDFTFRQPLTEQNNVIAYEIANCNAVSLHIRRGDYVSDKNASNIFAGLSPDYYYKAINYISSKIEDPLFFVFSDEIEWAKTKLSNYPCRFININQGKETYNDMRLMSLCKHNIIANSSFSWWGAYLNNNEQKIVIAPEIWYKNENNAAPIDILPAEWIKL